MKLKIIPFILFICIFIICGCSVQSPYKEPLSTEENENTIPSVSENGYFDYYAVPEFDGETPYVIINNNMPFFQESQIVTVPFESYGKLDNLGRCTVVCANVGKELMPVKDRESIGSIKPTGWQTVKYDFVDGKYLYNRCHLIAYMLTGENANENNLITGTRYMNTQGMLPFEDMVADYVKETSNHVLYRVSPIFLGTELVARGVLMEAYSVEDEGDGICFNVFVYNNQPGIEIDYLTGESKVSAESEDDVYFEEFYILNTSSKKFHLPDCDSVSTIKDNNKQEYKGSRDGLLGKGYSPCGACNP